MSNRRALFLGVLALASVEMTSALALALGVEVVAAKPSLVGEPHTFTVVPTEASGDVTYEWRFGEGAEFVAGGAEMSHGFDAPGLYSIDVVARDASGSVASAFFRHLVHYPLTPSRPVSSSSIVYDASRNRVYSVNQDNDTVTVVDAEALVNVGELPVYRKPESLALSPSGKLWVVHQDDFAVAVIDPDGLVIEGGFRLPYASQPVALAMSPTGDAAYISLTALGKLLKLDPFTGVVLGEADVGPKPRGIAVSHDGRDVYVTRFISADDGGELVTVDSVSMTTSARISLRLDTETEDSDQRARGLPNYLFAVGLTPDGRQAWIPGKKDNIARGLLRDGQDLTHDTTVRPLVAIVDTASASEIFESRVDLDDRSMPVHVEFSPYGNLAILTLAGSNRVEVRDITRPTQVFSAIAEVGAFPRASVLGPEGRLFVQGSLSRNILVYDASLLLDAFDQATPSLIADIPAVASEKLTPEVLLGKRLFHDAEDTRLAFEGYISCAGCHFEGLDDGRVYDFSTRGEGLRNTLSVRGNGGGRLNWTGTVDEVQDFEHQIRELFGGLGFVADDVLASGSYADPLGDSKKGLSADLDALSAYVTSLEHVNPSPYRNPDGTLTQDGLAGKELFAKLGCGFCHGGAGFSDSSQAKLHDVGTITPLSGTRAGGPLFGFDTPTLRGVWETAPYLHDGSAPTLRDVLVTRNPTGLHGYVAALAEGEVSQLVAYLLQIDDELPIVPLPFDPPSATPSTSAPEGMNAMQGAPKTAGLGEGGCSLAPVSTRSSSDQAWALALLLTAGALRRSRRKPASRARWASALAALSVTVGCNAAEPQSDETVDWSELPEVVVRDPELAPLGSRDEAIQRVCARGHGDSFASALCAGERPDLRDLPALLELAELSESRAFALTGNSTSLVARSVSALNPRALVFPRVGPERERPESMTAVGFVRGEQFVEVVSRDPNSDDFNFYLVSFEQPCNYEPAGCDLTALLSEEIERGWTAYSVYDEQDLEGTSFDCLSCHRPGGVGTRKMLRMQELSAPWLHWFPQRFIQRTESDVVLVDQFLSAHQADERYGGIPVATIATALDEGSGGQLEALLEAELSSAQPNAFDAQIALEMVGGSSPTWEARFAAHQRGEAIAVPYPAVDVTDPAKRAAAVQSYLDVQSGRAPRETLLDLREVFSADAEQKLSFVPMPGADAKSIVLQMCARCHDGRGNPELRKNRFDVLAFDTWSPAQKEAARARINAADPLLRMPPWRVGNLSEEALTTLNAALAP